MKDAPSTLRRRIVDHLTRQIAVGALAPGGRVPTESVLMAEFGASRMTVHHALRELTTSGLLQRHQGRGSFVAQPRPYVGVYDHQDIVSEIEGWGARHSARVVRQALRPAHADEAPDFALKAGDLLFHAVVVHLANGAPVELEDRLLNPAVLPGCMDFDLEKRSLFSLLLNSRPYREGRETVRAVLADETEQALLGLLRPEPCLEVVRRTWSTEGVVTRARLLRAASNAVMQGRIATAPPTTGDAP